MDCHEKVGAVGRTGFTSAAKTWNWIPTTFLHHHLKAGSVDIISISSAEQRENVSNILIVVVQVFDQLPDKAEVAKVTQK